ncbi:Ycf2 protein [Spatholobus suberectus]|nr:Ycf2 protein [Spatholobus suberectus]
MHGSDILWRIRQIPLCLPQWNLLSKIWNLISEIWNLISEIPSNCLHNLLLSEEIIHRNNELLLISTHLRSINVQEFLYSILFLLLVAGYLVRTHLLFFSRVYSELQTEFEKVKSLMIPSYMIELRKLLDRYPTSELPICKFQQFAFFTFLLSCLACSRYLVYRFRVEVEFSPGVQVEDKGKDGDVDTRAHP